jgi:hypothetical protein
MLPILSFYLTWPGARRSGLEKGNPLTNQTTQKESRMTEMVNKETNTTAINRPRP